MENWFVIKIVLGTALLGFISGITGTFTFLSKKTLITDAVSHAVLPGICLGFIAVGYKNPIALFIGAFATGWLALQFNNWLTLKTKIKEDTSIAITLSSFFGLGVVLLTYIQSSGNAEQSGLENYLFGNAAALSNADLWLFSISALCLVSLITLLFKEFKLVLFNPDFAISAGLPIQFFRFLISSITVFVIAAGIQAVGVVLMAALVITPPALARFWSSNLRNMMLISGLAGLLGAVSGTGFSLYYTKTPTGASIVLCLAALAILSILFGKEKGMVKRMWQQKRNQATIITENVLKIFFKISEQRKKPFKSRTAQELLEWPDVNEAQLKFGLKKLTQSKLLINKGKHWQLTEEGWEYAKTIVRRHRLWELYLTQKLKFADDHVHHDAEAMEHLITPEIEAQLQHELDYPTQDPHQKNIPS